MRTLRRTLGYDPTHRLPGFISGFASVLDLGGSLVPSVQPRRRGPRDDAEAMAKDWRAIGRDLWKVYGEVGEVATDEEGDPRG